jgi:hypothetical protein
MHRADTRAAPKPKTAPNATHTGREALISGIRDDGYKQPDTSPLLLVVSPLAMMTALLMIGGENNRELLDRPFPSASRRGLGF